MTYKNLLIEKKEKVALLTINRPEKMNALDSVTLLEMQDFLLKADDAEDIDVVIITGAGDKAFAAGADISELNKQDSLSGENFARNGQRIFDLIEGLGKPVIAAINGYALGGGFELALACHIRIASSKAHFGFPETGLGIIPGFGGTQRLSRVINSSRALEYILTTDIIDAEEAYRLGIVNKVFTPNEFLNKTYEMAGKIKSNSRLAVKMAIKAVRASGNTDIADGLAYEAALFGLCCGTDDFKERTQVFLDRKK